MAKFRSVVSREREIEEIPPARVAIRNHCLECCGYSPDEVKFCTSPQCWLYPWRFGRTPKELKRKGGGGEGLRNWQRK